MCHGGSLGVRVVLGEVGFTLVGHDLVLAVSCSALHGGCRFRSVSLSVGFFFSGALRNVWYCPTLS